MFGDNARCNKKMQDATKFSDTYIYKLSFLREHTTPNKPNMLLFQLSINKWEPLDKQGRN